MTQLISYLVEFANDFHILAMGFGVLATMLVISILEIRKFSFRMPISQFWFKFAVSWLAAMVIFVPAGIVFVLAGAKIFGADLENIHSIFFFLAGAASPNLARLKFVRLDKFIPPQLDFLLEVIRWVGELTIGYIPKILSREERTAIAEFCPSNYEHPIAKAYEFHCIEIARMNSTSKNITKANKVLKPLRINDHETKCHALLRFLGYKRGPILVRELAQNPDILYPEWTVARPQRLENHDSGWPNRQVVKWGRRIKDSPYTHKYIISDHGN